MGGETDAIVIKGFVSAHVVFVCKVASCSTFGLVLGDAIPYSITGRGLPVGLSTQGFKSPSSGSLALTSS